MSCFSLRLGLTVAKICIQEIVRYYIHMIHANVRGFVEQPSKVHYLLVCSEIGL